MLREAWFFRDADYLCACANYLSPVFPQGSEGSRPPGVDSRNQARRLPPDRPARRQARAAVHPQRPRLERSLSADHEAALRNRNSSFVIDGEAVLLGVDGRSDFNGLHSRKHDDEVEFYAFDMLVSDGEDLRKLPLSMRKTNLARLLARRVDGIFLAPTSNRARSGLTCSAMPA